MDEPVAHLIAYLVLDRNEIFRAEFGEIFIDVLVRQIAADEDTVDTAVVTGELVQPFGRFSLFDKLIQTCTCK